MKKTLRNCKKSDKKLLPSTVSGKTSAFGRQLPLKKLNLLKWTNSLIFIAALLHLPACQTARKSYTKYDQGQWNVEARITNPEKNMLDFEVALDIAAVNGDRLRVDAIGPLGTLVGSIMLTNSRATFIEYKSRKVFTGKPTASAMEKLIEVPVSPNIFYNLLFDEPIRSAGWKCESDSSGKLERCVQPKQNVTIQWKQKLAGTKVLVLSHAKNSIELKFKSFDEKIKNKDRRFQVKLPRSYKVYRL